MATANGKTVKLKYQGPDTQDMETVVPGEALFCDPVIPACIKPELEICTRFNPPCPGPADVNFPNFAVSEDTKVAIPAEGASPPDSALPLAGVSPGPAPQTIIPIPLAD